MTREEKSEEIQNEIFHEQNKERFKKIIKNTICFLSVLIILSLIFFSYTTYISTAKIGVREYRIKNNKIPDSFNGLKIVQLSDLHYGSTMFLEDVQKIIKLSNNRNPDIVVFTGDLLYKEFNLSSNEQEKLIQELKKINAPLGKYAILGDEDNERISTILTHSGFTVLRNESDLIYKDDNNPILLVGVSSNQKEQDIEKAYQYFKLDNHNSNIYTISLLHEPDTVDDIIGNYPSDLFMAGHSHNGNIRIPFKHFSFFKVKGALKYDQDYYKVQQSELYVSSGLGTKNGIRLFCRPSINFYRLSNH